MARGRRQKSESRPDLIFFFVFKISKDPRVCCVLGYLCNALWIKLKGGVGLSNGSCHWVGPSDGGPTCNGITRGRAASRSPDAADLPPTLVVFSKCGVGKDLDLGMIWGPKPRNFYRPTLVHLPGAKTKKCSKS